VAESKPIRLRADRRIQSRWGVVAAVLAALFFPIGLLVALGKLGDFANSAILGAIGAGLGVVILAAWWLEIQAFWLELHDDGHLRSYRPFRSRALHAGAADGFRVVETPSGRYVVLVRGKRTLVRIPWGIEDRERVLAWLRAHSKDLDAEDRRREREQIERELRAQLLDPGQIAAHLKRARTVAMALNVATFAGLPLGVLAGFTNPPLIDIGALFFVMATPFGAIAARIAFPKVSRFDSSPSGEYAFLGLPVIIPGGLLALSALLAYGTVLEPDALWTAAVLLAAAPFIPLLMSGPCVRRSAPSILFFAAFLMAYGYGAAEHLNVLLDSSAKRTFTAEILDYRGGPSRRASDILVVGPWGDRIGPNEILFIGTIDKGDVGTRVQIPVYGGALGIPYVEPVEVELVE
jgi:hypothetical protein